LWTTSGTAGCFPVAALAQEEEGKRQLCATSTSDLPAESCAQQEHTQAAGEDIDSAPTLAKKRPRVHKTKLFGRTRWVVKGEENGDKDKTATSQSQALASIRAKLGTVELVVVCSLSFHHCTASGGKVSKAQKRAAARDPEVLARLPSPTFIDSRVGRG